MKPDGTVGAVYRKMHLVPFGEYVPLQSVLFFVGPIVGAVAEFSSFTPGTMPVLLPVGDTSASTAICYEVIYPEPDPPVRPRRQRAADDDHQRRLVRPVVGRLSALGAGVDARDRGRAAISRAPPTPASAASSIRTAASSRRRRCSSRRSSSQDVRFITDRTIYSRIGDLVAWLSLALTAAALLAAWQSSIESSLAIDNAHSTIDNRSHPTSAISNPNNRILLWPYNWTNSFAGIRISRAAPPTCGAIFDAARPAEELATIEERVADPDFWKDQAAAQKLLQRRRRLEDDRDLSESLRRRADDLAVLVEWAEAGEPVADDLARGLDELVDARSTPARPRRCSAASTIARTRSSRSIRAPAAPSRRTGPRCCCACTCAGRSGAASSAR